MSKEAPDCLIDIWVQGDEAHIDRNFNPIIEGQRSHVRFRFHFVEGWNNKPCRMVTLINAARIYTTEMHFDEVLVPIYMLKEGDLRFIVRGFNIEESAVVVIRDGHFFLTNDIREDDIKAFAAYTSDKRFKLSDEKVGDIVSVMYSSAGVFDLSNEATTKITHDVKPISEDENGYVEVNNIEDPIYVTGGINGCMLRR